ncbi:hypothetical protein JOD54_005340 [Actinokineospora baliensis]|nr:hypothetical protein [Actinokineospora baliensis]
MTSRVVDNRDQENGPGRDKFTLVGGRAKLARECCRE